METVIMSKYSYQLYVLPFFKTDGFFLECGAFDGETSSNTVYLEHKRGWTGLLVEMDPYFFTQLRGKNRRAHSINACLSPTNHTILASNRITWLHSISITIIIANVVLVLQIIICIFI